MMAPLPGLELALQAQAPRFACVLADPPWLERGGGVIKRGADRHYPLMATAAIARLPVARVLAGDAAHLWLWVTNNFLEDGLAVMKAWGFRYVTNVVWVKDRAGLGQYVRGKHELLLFGVAGEARVPPPARRPPSVLEVQRGRHSQKPAEAVELLERVSPGPRLELFGRGPRPGWLVLGNQASGEAPAAGQDIESALWRLIDGRPVRLLS